MTIQEDALQPFLDRIFVSSHSLNTVKSYRAGINQFSQFLDQRYQAREFEIIFRIKDGRLDVYRILDEFVVHLDKQGYKPRTIRAWVAPVKEYLRYNGIKIYSEDCRQAVKMPKKTVTREEPLTKEILVRLLHVLPIKIQTAILVACASGMRIGELVQLRISDVDFDSVPTRVTIRAETTKGKVGRETYLTSEATTMLKDFLKREYKYETDKFGNAVKHTTIFGSIFNDTGKGRRKIDYDLVQHAENVLGRSLRWHISKIPELNAFSENGRRSIHFHAFRKFFRTTVGNAVGRDYAEALMGHVFYLDTYYNLPVEKRREMYLKAEPYLTISDFAQVEKNLNKMAERQREIQEALAKFGLKLVNSLDL